MATPMHFLDVARMLRAVAIDSLSLPLSVCEGNSRVMSFDYSIFDNNQKYVAFPPSSSLFLLVSKSPQWVVHLQLL